MSICNHGIAPEKCILCKKLLPPEPPQNHKMATPLPMPTIQATNVNINTQGLAAPSVLETVHILSAPQITDPQAKNVLQLAQEYAQAQDDVSVIRANVKQLQDTLAESKIKLAEAEKDCATKQWALTRAVTPDRSYSSSAVATVMIESEENEEPSYVNKYQK